MAKFRVAIIRRMPNSTLRKCKMAFDVEAPTLNDAINRYVYYNIADRRNVVCAIPI